MYRILICDDEKDIRESTADYMKCEGLSVALASDGYEAVKSVKYREENGKKIITTLNFFNIAVNEPYTLKLGKEKGKEKEIYNSEAVYSNLVENKESVKMSYSFARAFQDKFNTEMQKRYRRKLQAENISAVTTAVAIHNS